MQCTRKSRQTENICNPRNWEVWKQKYQKLKVILGKLKASLGYI